MAKILFLEDHPFMASISTRMLESAGHIVTWRCDGKAGLDSFIAERPDLLITDLFMPEMDGIEVIRAVRAVAPEFPIIALSGGGDMEGFEMLDIAKGLGVNEAIRKPASAEELIEAVSRSLA